MEFGTLFKAGNGLVLSIPKSLREGYSLGGKVAIVRRDDGAIVIRPLESVLPRRALDGDFSRD